MQQRQQQQQESGNNTYLNNNSGSSNHVVDLGGGAGVKVRSGVVTLKGAVLVVGVVLGVVLVVQVVMMYSLDAGQEARRQREPSSQHVHPEVLDLAMSKISKIALGEYIQLCVFFF